MLDHLMWCMTSDVVVVEWSLSVTPILGINSSGCHHFLPWLFPRPGHDPADGDADAFCLSTLTIDGSRTLKFYIFDRFVRLEADYSWCITSYQQNETQTKKRLNLYSEIDVYVKPSYLWQRYCCNWVTDTEQFIHANLISFNSTSTKGECKLWYWLMAFQHVGLKRNSVQLRNDKIFTCR